MKFLIIFIFSISMGLQASQESSSYCNVYRDVNPKTEFMNKVKKAAKPELVRSLLLEKKKELGKVLTPSVEKELCFDLKQPSGEKFFRKVDDLKNRNPRIMDKDMTYGEVAYFLTCNERFSPEYNGVTFRLLMEAFLDQKVSPASLKIFDGMGSLSAEKDVVKGKGILEPFQEIVEDRVVGRRITNRAYDVILMIRRHNRLLGI